MIRDRGLMLHSAVSLWDKRLRVGDRLELRCPDGSRGISQITGIATLHRSEGPCELAVMLPPQLSTDDVPVGTEVWRAPDSAMR
jgi:hypothetical protein